MTDAADRIRFIAVKAARGGLTLVQARAYFDSLVIGDALVLSCGNVSKAAMRLGVNRTWLQRKMRPHTDGRCE